MAGVFFFFQAEDGIRDYKVTGVQTCALPISSDDALTRDLTARRGPATRQAAGAASQDDRGCGALGSRAPQRAARPGRRTRVAAGSRSRAARRGPDRSGLSAAWESPGREGDLRSEEH